MRKLLLTLALTLPLLFIGGQLNSQVSCGPNQTMVDTSCQDTNDYVDEKTDTYWFEARICGLSKCGWKYIKAGGPSERCVFCNDNTQQ